MPVCTFDCLTSGVYGKVPSGTQTLPIIKEIGSKLRSPLQRTPALNASQRQNRIVAESGFTIGGWSVSVFAVRDTTFPSSPMSRSLDFPKARGVATPVPTI